MPNPDAQVGAGKSFVRINNWSRGEHRKADEYDLPEGWAKALKNWYLTDDGSLIMRRGTLRWNVTSLGAARTRGSTRAYPTNGNTPHFLAYQGTIVSLGTDSTKTFANSRTGLSATALMTFTQWLKYVYAPNGVDAHQKWDANTQAWEPWGQAAPTTGPTANLSATIAGTLTGKYQFKVTYLLVSGAESNGSVASGLVEVLVVTDPTDEFDRAANNSLGANWTESEFGATAFRIEINNLVYELPSAGVAGDAIAFYSGTTFKGDQSCSVTWIQTLETGGTIDREWGIGVRMAGTRTNFTGYCMVYDHRRTSGVDDRWRLIKYVSANLSTGTGKTVLATQPGDNQLVANDVIKIRVTGSLIEGLVNGTVVVSAVDTAIATGSPGAILVTTGVAINQYNVYVDSFVMTGAATKQIDLSAIPIGPAGTAKRRIYGFKDAVSSVYLLVKEIADNTTTTTSITTYQDVWTTEIPTDNDAPSAKAWIGALHKNRLWLAADSDNPTRLYFSKARASAAGVEAEYWPVTNFLDIDLDDGDKITALLPLGDVLLVFGNESVFYVTGDSDFSFFPRRSNATRTVPCALARW